MPAKIIGRTEKTCSRCKNLLPMSEFHTSPSKMTGASRCKLCESEAYKQRKAADPEKLKATGRKASAKWAKAHPEQNATMSKASKAAYYARNSSELKTKVAAWQAANPDLVRMYKRLNRHKRRAKMKGASIAVEVIRQLFALFGGACAYCRTSPASEIDHIMPLSKGGLHAIENLAPACAHCNRSKNASLPAAFQARTGYDVQAVINQVTNLTLN